MSLKILEAAKMRFDAEAAVALANVDVYIDNPVGVGEHGDIVIELSEQIKKASEASDNAALCQRIFDERVNDTLGTFTASEVESCCKGSTGPK